MIHRGSALAAVLTFSLTVLAGCGGGPRASVGRLPLRQVTQLAFPAGADRFDYQSIDPGRHRLFVAHLAEDEIEVVDLMGPRMVATIRDVPAATGVLAVPSLGRMFASAGEADEVRVYDEDSLALLGRAPTGGFPDGVSYDADNGRVYVSDEHGGDLTVLDAHAVTAIARVPLGGEAGNNAYDPSTREVWVDVQTRSQLVAVDPATNHVTRRFRLPGCDHDHGLLLDPAARRGFVACDGNNRLLVVDLDTGAVLQRLSVGGEPDVLAFDAGLRRLYVATESGVIAVFAEIPGGALHPIGRGYLADNAHTVAVDETTHQVYFALRSLRGHPTLLVMEPM